MIQPGSVRPFNKSLISGHWQKISTLGYLQSSSTYNFYAWAQAPHNPTTFSQSGTQARYRIPTLTSSPRVIWHSLLIYTTQDSGSSSFYYDDWYRDSDNCCSVSKSSSCYQVQSHFGFDWRNQENPEWRTPHEFTKPSVWVGSGPGRREYRTIHEVNCFVWYAVILSILTLNVQSTSHFQQPELDEEF